MLLRIEALVVFATGTALFFYFGGEFWLFAALFFAPDISVLGYAVSKKAGAALYYAVHNYAFPALLALIGVLSGYTLLWQIALIFTAHAAFDRSLGYGSKYAIGFQFTHFGKIGKPNT